jgi:hypothetical protein
MLFAFFVKTLPQAAVLMPRDRGFDIQSAAVQNVGEI